MTVDFSQLIETSDKCRKMQNYWATFFTANHKKFQDIP